MQSFELGLALLGISLANACTGSGSDAKIAVNSAVFVYAPALNAPSQERI